ncbi:hypothetical protein KAN5_19400 [Pseudoalteromonas sp. KAN5]|nr:hypothetical protein KAN5_19400 [Pseudoalteromonas sp. KAN5]
MIFIVEIGAYDNDLCVTENVTNCRRSRLTYRNWPQVNLSIVYAFTESNESLCDRPNFSCTDAKIDALSSSFN